MYAKIHNKVGYSLIFLYFCTIMFKRIMKHTLRLVFFLVVFSFAALSFAQVNKWRDMYQVKKKDTIYGIATKYEISTSELMDANPEMKTDGYTLKKGDYIFIPFAKSAVEPVKSQTILKEVDIRKRAIRIGVMLPLHDVDGDGRRMTEYYRGLLMACDSLKKEGISMDIQAWNVPIEGDIRQILLDDNAKNRDVIFGPLYTSQVKTLGNFCKTYGIKMVVPFSISSDEVATNPQMFQMYQSPSMLNEQNVDAFIKLFSVYHPVFVDCNDSTSQKGAFTFALRKELDKVGISYNITNLKSSEEAFGKAFSKSKYNVVILNTARSPELNVAIAKLNGYQTNNPSVSISLFGYTEWLMYTKYNLDNFFKFDTYIPSTFYYNPLSQGVKSFENSYHKWFNTEMLNALPRFAITGYDQAKYILTGLHKYGGAFNGNKLQFVTNPVQTPLYFKRYSSGGLQNNGFTVIHYTRTKNINLISL